MTWTGILYLQINNLPLSWVLLPHMGRCTNYFFKPPRQGSKAASKPSRRRSFLQVATAFSPSWCCFYRSFHGHCSRELASLIPSTYPTSNPILSFKLTDTSVTITQSIYQEETPPLIQTSFIPRTSTVWNSLPNECFPSVCKLDSFKKMFTTIFSPHLGIVFLPYWD